MTITLRTYEEFRESDAGNLVIADNTVDNSYNFPISGNLTTGYSSHFAKFSLWNLEHFASRNGPSNAIIGQLWFDNYNRILKVCVGKTGNNINWKDISASPAENVFSKNDILPKTTDTYNLGSEDNPFNLAFFDNVTAENLFFNTDTGAISLSDALSITSDDVIFNGIMPYRGYSLTETLNTLYQYSASRDTVTFITDSVFAPKRGTVYIGNSTDPIILTINKMSSGNIGDSFTISNFNTGTITVLNGNNVKFNSTVGDVSLTDLTAARFILSDISNGINNWVVTGDFNYVI